MLRFWRATINTRNGLAFAIRSEQAVREELVGLALSLSGHATTAEPTSLTQPSVFLHGVCVAFWIGSLVPLFAAVHASVRGDRSLAPA